MFITMVISGIWHGAEWGFVIWGRLHALGRCLTRELELTDFYKERIPRLVKQMLVFAFVTFTWIFFRAADAGEVLADHPADIHDELGRSAVPAADGGVGPGGVALPAPVQQPSRRSAGAGLAPVKVGLAMFMIAYLLIVAQPSTRPFIYFQF